MDKKQRELMTVLHREGHVRNGRHMRKVRSKRRNRRWMTPQLICEGQKVRHVGVNAVNMEVHGDVESDP